ncbi:MAG: branched-chain amino acid ABC transporter substrate-binding protein [Clostridiales bacterium]|nr:branched-chain amino acid ABC transporter substrate-binding protein [Clostridiales bacterium]
MLISCMLVISFVGCSNKNNENIMIGVMVPTSGSEAYYGNDMLQSYQLACDEINASGGVLGRKLELYVADDGCDPNMATLAASKIIAKNVDFVVGGYGSSATIPTLQQYYDANLIMLISCANSTEITKLGFNQSFMLNSPMSYEAVTFTDLCKSLDVKNVALIHQGDTATKTLSDYCEKILPENGIKIATVQVTEKNTPDVSAVVTSIRSSNADLVYWCGYHADGSNVIKQLRRGGYTGKIAVGDGSASTELITACGTDGEGVYITSPPFVKFSEGGEKFVDDYRAKFNAEPGTYATLSYDTIYVLKTAIEEAGSTDFASVRDAVQNIEYKGLSGLIKFNQNREREVSNFIILQIKNGEFQLITL